MAIATSGMTGGAAQAAAPTGTQDYEMGQREQYQEFYWQNIRVGAGTTTIVIEPSTAAVGPTVHCDLYTVVDDATTSRDFTAEEWTGSPSPQFEVAPGALSNGGGVGCTSGDPAAAGWSFTWDLRGGGDQETVTLAEFNDPRLVYYDAVDHYFETGDARAVAAGDVITISSDSVGTWPRDDDGDAVSRSALLQSTDPAVATLRIDDVTVDEFGRTLTVRLPDPLPVGFAGHSARLTATSSYRFYEPEVSFTTQWSADVTIVGANATSTITARTNRRIGVSRERLTAVARVESTGVAPSGTVEFSVDGRSVGTAPVRSTESGATATLRLPRLDRGAHTLTSTYSGADGLTGSTSAPSRFYIVI